MGIKERIANGLKKLPVKVRSAVIYGSWAKGTQKEDSDIDILMISDEVNPRKQKRGREIATIKEQLSVYVPLDIFAINDKRMPFKFQKP